MQPKQEKLVLLLFVVFGGLVVGYFVYLFTTPPNITYEGCEGDECTCFTNGKEIRCYPKGFSINMTNLGGG